MTSALHGVLQAMDTIANAPALLSARLLDPAPTRRPEQSASDLTPPKIVKRKRRLTLPLDAPVPGPSKAKWFSKAGHQRTCDQAQSPLMRLPAELRDQIWSYSETIDLIYSLPTFSFRYQNVETFFAFVCAILPHRRDKIRTLDLRWLGQCKMPDGTPQPLEHQMNLKWSYARISNIKALSGLPRPAASKSSAAFVTPDLVIDEVLEGMSGLEEGGVKWGCRSTGCFRQEGAGSGLADVFVSATPRIAQRSNPWTYAIL